MYQIYNDSIFDLLEFEPSYLASNVSNGPDSIPILSNNELELTS